MQEAPLPEGFSLIEDTPPLPEGFTLIEDPVAEKRHTPRKDIEASPERIAARKNVRNLGDAVSLVLPGRIVSDLASNVPGYEYAKPVVDTVTDHLDTGLKAYANYAYGAARGLPVAGAYIDEAVGGLASLLGYDGDKATETVRAMDDVSEENYGASNTLGRVVGGLAGGYGVGANVVRQGAPLLVNAARSGLAASLVGAAHEFGEGEGRDDRLDRAESGAKWGAGLGVALPLAGNAIARPVAWGVDKLVGDRLSQVGRSAEDAADAILLSKIQRSGQEPKDIMDHLEKGRYASQLNGGGDSASIANLPETIADSSEALQRFTGAVYRQGDEGAEIISKALERRQKGPLSKFSPNEQDMPGQIEDVSDAFDRALLIKSAGSARKTEKALVAEQRAEAGKLYRKAFKNSEPFDISRVLTDTRFHASEYAGKINKKLNKAVDLFYRGKNRMIVSDIRLFDNSKKELDDMISKARGNEKRELAEFKTRLLDAVHKVDGKGQPVANLGYKEAREQWGSSAEMQDAIAMGRKAFRDDSEDVLEVFQTMSPGQQRMFRIGASDGLRLALARKGRGHDVTKILDERRVIEVLRKIIPETKGTKGVYSDRTERFGDYINRQENMVRTRNIVKGGSPTSRNDADDLDLNVSSLKQQFDRVRNLPGVGLIGEAVVIGLNTVLGYSKANSARLAKLLVESSPERQAQILQRLQDKVGKGRYEKFIRELDRVSAGLAASPSTTD